jgi:hypothetical protein
MRLRRRFWPEAILAAISGFLAILTAVWHDWIEGLTGLNPDQQSGASEVSLVLVLAVVAGTMAVLARIEWRRAHSLLAKG